MRDIFRCSYAMINNTWCQCIYHNAKRVKTRKIPIEEQALYEKEWNDAMTVFSLTGVSPMDTIFGKQRGIVIPFEKFVKREKKCVNFLMFAGNNIRWEDIDNELLYQYRDWLISKGYAQNSQRSFMTQVKVIIDKARNLGYPVKANKYDVILREKVASTLNVYLTMQELKKIETISFDDEKLESARIRFLIGCYTGARFSDYSQLRESSIVDGEYINSDGIICKSPHIQYISQKTHSFCQIPASQKAIALLKREVKEISINDMNRYLPMICQKAGVDAASEVLKGDQKIVGEKWRFVASHTARRTFANNLYIMGVPIETIARYLGHSSPDITMKNYISCPLRINEIALNKFFG